VDQPVLEGEPVDEGLQGRAGRAHRLCHVDLTGATLVEIVGTGDARQHFAGRMVDRHDGDRDVGAERVRALACEVFERLLRVRVDGERDHRAAGCGGNGLIGGVRRERRHRPSRGWRRFRLGVCHFIEGKLAGRRDTIKHAVARAMGGLRRAVGPAHFRRLRDRDQHRGLAEREAPRLLAEIGERGGACAFEIAAVRRKPEIEREDLVLGERALELHRAHRLAQLGKERAIGARFEQPRDLHGDGRAARHDAAVRHELHGSARNRERIDADVLAEALVLVGDQQVEITRIDVGDGRGQPPASVRGRIGPQQAAVAVHHDGGEFKRFAERHGPKGMDPGGEGGGGSKRNRGCAERDCADTAPHARSVPAPLEGEG